MSREQLIQSIDRQFGHSNASSYFHLALAQCYRDELLRRENKGTTNQMLCFTAVIVAATIVNLLLDVLC
jgi:hypothetical protein